MDANAIMPASLINALGTVWTSARDAEMQDDGYRQHRR
jgi:hypothetical protein